MNEGVSPSLKSNSEVWNDFRMGNRYGQVCVFVFVYASVYALLHACQYVCEDQI